MKGRLALIGAVAAMALGGTSAAIAAGHDTPGTPGTPNCQGQTIAYLNQAGKSVGVHGLGNIADVTGMTVQQLHDLVETFCAA